MRVSKSGAWLARLLNSRGIKIKIHYIKEVDVAYKFSVYRWGGGGVNALINNQLFVFPLRFFSFFDEDLSKAYVFSKKKSI